MDTLNQIAKAEFSKVKAFNGQADFLDYVDGKGLGHTANEVDGETKSVRFALSIGGPNIYLTAFDNGYFEIEGYWKGMEDFKKSGYSDALNGLLEVFSN